MKLFRKNAQTSATQIGRFAIVCSLLLIIAGCGKDSDDGEVVTPITLPVDNVLNLYCADIGIHTETCVLDDPKNPYASVPFVTENPPPDDEPGEDFNRAKFQLANAAPSPKAKFYVFATAQARAPSGENQWYTARALYELFDASGSDLIKDQAIRAYRSVLDNYFDSATFFELGTTGIFYPFLLRQLAGQDLAYGVDFGGGTNLMFDPVQPNNEFIARNQMGGWGYTLTGGPPPALVTITKN